MTDDDLMGDGDCGLDESVDALYDMFLEDPETAMAMASEDEGDLYLELFRLLLDELPSGADWSCLLRMAEALAKSGNLAPFHEVAHALQMGLSNKAFHEALVHLGDAHPDMRRFNEALMGGVFTDAIRSMPKRGVLALLEARSSYAESVFVVHAGGQIERHLISGDLKRAFDALVFARKTANEFGCHLPHFDTWVERVWSAHFEAELVTDLTDDPREWRNCSKPLVIVYGTRPGGRKVQFKVQEQGLAMIWLWASYVQFSELISEARRRARLKRGWGDGPLWASSETWHSYPVSRTGAMLRDMIRYWHLREKKRKLTDFCRKHGVDVPAWPGDDASVEE